jgi:hypothetical protein
MLDLSLTPFKQIKQTLFIFRVIDKIDQIETPYPGGLDWLLDEIDNS